MNGMFHVTRHRRPHLKDQEYRGSFQTEEQANEQIALLKRDEAFRRILKPLETFDDNYTFVEVGDAIYDSVQEIRTLLRVKKPEDAKDV
jgi:hypothetical protein